MICNSRRHTNPKFATPLISICATNHQGPPGSLARNGTSTIDDRQRTTPPSLPDPSRALHRLPFPSLPRRGKTGTERVPACRGADITHPSIHPPQMGNRHGMLHLPYLTVPPTNHALPYLAIHPTQAMVQVVCENLFRPRPVPHPRPWFAPKVCVRGRQPAATTERTPSTVEKERQTCKPPCSRSASQYPNSLFSSVALVVSQRQQVRVCCQCPGSMSGVGLGSRRGLFHVPARLPSHPLLQHPQSHSPRPIGPHKTQALLCRRRRRTPIEEITKPKKFPP